MARTAVGGVAARAGADQTQLDAIKLAVSEAITNAVVHAYPDGTGSVYVRAVIVDGQFRVSIIDDGTGPHIPSATPGLGCGLALIAASTDQFTIRRRPKRGTVTMVDGPGVGLELLEALAGAGVLSDYHLRHAVRGDLLARLGRDQEAATSFLRAAELTANVAEAQFLRARCPREQRVSAKA